MSAVKIKIESLYKIFGKKYLKIFPFFARLKISAIYGSKKYGDSLLLG